MSKDNILEQQGLLKEEIEDLQIEFELFDTQPERYNSTEIANIDGKLDAAEARIKELDSEIDRLINHADGLDYTVAVAVGILTGLIDSFFVGEIDWAKEKGEVHKIFNKFIENKAKSEGYQGKGGLKGAIDFLEKKYSLASDASWKGNGFSSAKSHHLDDFAHHPTILGLLANIVSTLFRVGIFNNKNGEWHLTLVETDAKELIKIWSPIILSGLLHWLVAIAERKYTEKQQKELPKPIRILVKALASAPAVWEIIKITDNWIGHLISDMGGSKNSSGDGMGIPGIFLSLLKELSSVPPFNMTGLPKLINDWYTKGKFDMRAEATVLQIAGKQAIPVILNEIFVRGFYFVRRLIGEAQEHGTDWNKYDWQKTLPFNNRTIVRMLTISHGTFVAVDLADAAIRTAVSGQYTDPATFLARMALRVNFVGLGRFTIAVYSDIKMGFQRRYKVAERMKLHSEMLHLYDAKLFYKQENMWIEAKNSELATREVYEAAVYSVKYFFQAFARMDEALDRIDSNAIEENNPGLIDEVKGWLQ